VFKRLFIMPCLLCISLNSWAEIRFNGFASVHMTSVDTDGGTGPFSQYGGDGDISFKEESLFALQASSYLSEGLSATVQLVAEGKDDFMVDARWAYISYDINDTHRVSAGRFANPIFYQSEYEKVGYAHNYARLPKSVYTGFDFSTIEGITLDSNFYIGDYTLATKVLFGTWRGSTFLAATGKDESFGLKNLVSGRATVSGDGWNVFLGSLITEMEGGSVDQNAILAAAQPGISAATAAGASQNEIDNFKKAITWEGKDGIYSYMGFNIDRNNYLVDFEFTSYGVDDSSDGWNETWYLGFGYRVSESVAIIMHTEEFKQDANDTEFLNNTSNPILFATGKGILSALAAREFDGYGLTLRYDFHPSATFKADVFSGTDTRASVGDYSFISAGIDLVF